MRSSVDLSRFRTIADLRAGARGRLPRAVFDFVDGAAEDELTARRNRSDYRRLEFEPRALVDVSRRNLATTVLGLPVRMPVIIAPTGLSALVWPQAEKALARAAQACGIPVAVSMCASVRLEQVAEAAADGRRWFQVYVFRDRDLVKSLVKRARVAGYETLVITVDVPVLGQRERDHRLASQSRCDYPRDCFGTSSDARAGVTESQRTAYRRWRTSSGWMAASRTWRLCRSS